VTEWQCVVCGEPVDESNSAVCDGCGERYHLNKRNDAPGKDCGDVRVHDLYMSLEYGCNICRGVAPGPAPSAARGRSNRHRLARGRPHRYRRRE